MRRAFSYALLAAIALGPVAEAAAAEFARRVVPARQVRIGMNLAPVKYYGTNLPFADVFKASRPWEEKGGAVQFDAAGYPRLYLGRTVESLMLRDLDGHYPEGDYVVTWKGTGDVDMNRFDTLTEVSSEPGRIAMLVAPANGGLLLEVRKSDLSDPVRDLHVWMPGFADRQPLFNPAFVERLRPFPVVRFMEWQRTNGSPLVEWPQRPRVEDARYSTDRGVPLEVMIALANELGADPWFTLPHEASDRYVREFATMVRDLLSPDRTVYVEYSNEVWNAMFPQSGWVRDKGVAARLADDPNVALLRFYSQRSVEVMKIFEEVFGGSERLVRVAGSQAENSWMSEKILEWKDAHEHFDALGIAPYFGNRFGSPDAVDEVSTWSTTKLLDELEKDIDGKNKEAIEKQAEVARKFGVQLVAYEGGQHLVGYGGAENDILLADLFIEANRSPRMYDLYRRHLDHWAAAGGGLFVAFNDVGRPSKWGSWGAREYLLQPLAEAPKERALLERTNAPRRLAGRRAEIR